MKEEVYMGKKNIEFCTMCGEMAEFLYDGEQWVCQNCGSFDCQGEFSESLPPFDNEDEDI